MLDNKDIKIHLLSTIPKYGIKILVNTDFNAYTVRETNINCIHEESLFGINLTDSDNLSENNYYFCYRFLLANLLQQENFANVNLFFSNFFAFYDKNILKYPQLSILEDLSPFKYYIIKEGKEEMQEIVKEIKVGNKNNNQTKKFR